MVYHDENVKGFDVRYLFQNKPESFFIGVFRLVFGWIWIWAFLDKLFGLGFATASDRAWINGGSPTIGYLSFGVNPESPFASFFTETLVQFEFILNFMFMGMLLFVGVTMLTGVLVRLGSVAGLIFSFSVYLATIPLANNPIVDVHVLYMLTFVMFIFTDAGRFLGLGDRFSSLDIVKRFPILK